MTAGAVIAADLLRLAVFQDEHPEVAVSLVPPMAFTAAGKVSAGSLHELLARLDEVYPPGARHGSGPAL